MLIRHKLLLSAVMSVGALVAMFGLHMYSGKTQLELALTADSVSRLERDVLELRNDEKNFLSRREMTYVNSHAEHAQGMQEDLATVRTMFEKFALPSDTVNRFSASTGKYLAIFDEIVALQQDIGLTPTTGLYGRLREAVQEVETLLKSQNQLQITVLMLQLRREEKNFMLRRDMSEVDRFEQNFIKFEAELSQALMDEGIKTEISRQMQHYRTSFLALVTKEREIGLSHNDGKFAELQQVVEDAEQATVALSDLALAEIQEREAKSSWVAITVFIIIVLMVSVVTFIIIRSIVRPINNISQMISTVGREKNLTLRCDTGTEDEIAEIAIHFNQMVENFQSMIQQVNDAAERMNHSCIELSNNATLASDGVTRQLSETDMVATAITEMGATIDEIAKNTEFAAERANDTHHNARNGQLGVERTIDKIASLSRQLTSSAAVVGELERDSGTIGSVLGVIRGIAEQTNLLALNAAIEAARAGEQGRGFAVVADEVRSLAMRTQESTEEIAGIIQTLQNRTRSIVQLMESSQRQGVESSEQAASAGTLLDQINSDVANIMEMSTQIAAAIEEQSCVASEVSKNVVTIRDIAEESSEAAKANARASNDVREQASYLKTSVNQFRIS